ncbi:MAG: ATPase [Cetobacterium sp.]|uniref:ATPase n=1 Tax=Cetobacterium sp. TaxID=2071632 RepID=UPI003F3FBD22
MEEIKRVLKRGFVTSGIILVYGVVTFNPLVYFGMFVGSLLSILGFYLICLDAKASVMSNSPFKIGVTGYLKRYAIYGIFLGATLKFLGLPMFVSSVIGLLSIRFNILLMALFDNIKKFKAKHLNFK